MVALTTCIKKELITMVYNYGLYNVGPPNDSVQLVYNLVNSMVYGGYNELVNGCINQLVTMGPHIVCIYIYI